MRTSLCMLGSFGAVAVLVLSLLSGCSHGQFIKSQLVFPDRVEQSVCEKKYVVIPYYAVVVMGFMYYSWEGDCRTQTLPVKGGPV